ncbi:hypothetical protein JQS43_07720 [Natronosporangium hydrolyticum]|uniref:Uncharacterized protein n=1 Tax=Natronosporangium hydrolyticum TaxID=2811111 RepID=A0A895YN99_9ACTN|nr:hypothetical protein [Natronosporangium hydrolyticum]QSB16176.1 hypothetical protein JQS43_07720 [Natronosporangium hydrolyticum]
MGDMELLRKIKAILLDLDGTLGDPDAAVARAYQRWSVEWMVDPQHDRWRGTC